MTKQTTIVVIGSLRVKSIQSSFTNRKVGGGGGADFRERTIFEYIIFFFFFKVYSYTQNPQKQFSLIKKKT